MTKDEIDGHMSEDNVYSWYDNNGFLKELENVLHERNLIGGNIGVNSTARAFNIIEISNNIDVNFVNGKSLLEDVRIIKSEDEIEKIKKAAEGTDKVMEDILNYIKPGVTEGKIESHLAQLFKKQGMVQEFAIVASGPNSAMPHYSGRDRIIEDKDIVLLDIGGKYEGLCSDMTRTVFVGGIEDKEKELYDLVLESNLKGVEYVRKGILARDIDRVARDVIEKGNYGKCFPTRLGHGIGYSVHEAPYINGYSDLVIENGMVFSIEPGIYIKDEFGIRIEDIVVVEDGTGKSINHASKEIIIL